MKKTYVFDMDGTLIDSVPYVIKNMGAVCARHGIDYTKEIIDILTPLGYYKSSVYLIERFKLSMSAEELTDEFLSEVYPSYRDEIKIDSEIADFLRRLRDSGANLYLFTASPHSFVEATLKSCGVFDLFDRIFAVDDFGLTKSDKKIYELLAGTLGVAPSEIDYFEDSPTALRNAKAAGYITHAVYEKQNSLSPEIMRAEFDEFIPSLTEYAKAYK